MKRSILILASLLLFTSCAPINPDGDVPSNEDVIGDIEIYAINDFHGAINPSYSNEIGVLKLASFLKEKKKQGNTIVVNSGDYWQGTLASNINKGRMLTEISNEVEFDAFTIGNHEFDWGDSFIKANTQLKSKSGYSTPVLAANIYYFDIMKKTVLDFAGLGSEYTITTLDNGIKVGIIGYIGPSQISSITSNHVDHLTFIDPLPIVEETSKHLRENEGCHVVILSAHEGVDDILSESMYGKYMTDYVDVILGAHTHQVEKQQIGNVPCLQAGANGTVIGQIKLSYSSKEGIKVNSINHLYKNQITTEIDSEIQSIYNKYNDEIEEISNTKIATFDRSLSRENASNLMVASLADHALDNDIDISYTIINNARTAIYNNEVYYPDIYKAYPFDNIVYIAEVYGRDLLYELKYAYFYRLDPQALQTNKKYKIAVIDYVLLHRNDYRNYDNFTNFEILGQYNKTGVELYTYRDVCVDYLLDLSENYKVINSSYYNNLNVYNYSYIQQDVELDYNPYVVQD